MNAFWQGLNRQSRIGLITGIVFIFLVLIGGSWWLLRTDYQVLFSDLKPQDAAAMTAELDRLKIPYKIGDNGNSIFVDGTLVHATRIKLMGKDIPLHGAVGLELFNNTDFGMTEFAQKINYQRALQGELTRTIMSLAEVRDVRVHLALPEQGLFKQASSKAKAAITLTLRQGLALQPEQVIGIQRLVAASVPGMTSQEVTIVDNRGVALNKAANVDADSAYGNTRLDIKKETEAYLTRKLSLILERTFGGNTLASVDVTLNMDQIKTTTEDILGVPGRGQMTGIVVRERETTRDNAVPPLDAKSGGTGSRSGGAQREVEYQTGRRVEQVVVQPGAVRRIQAVAVIPVALSESQEEQLRRTIAAALGVSAERGDSVVIQTAAKGQTDVGTEAHEPQVAPNATNNAQERADQNNAVFLALAALLAVLVTLGGAWLVFKTRKINGYRPPLTENQRLATLNQIRDWMQQGTAGADLSGKKEGVQ